MKPIDKLTTALALQDESETLQALCTELVLARFVAQALIDKRDPEAAVLCYVNFLKGGEQRIIPDCFLPAGLRGFVQDGAFIAALEAWKLWDSSLHSEHRLRNLQKALQLVRDTLDAKEATLDSQTVDRLFDAEALLSVELGQPVWEGREKQADGRYA